jgi:hypothetical protein
MVFVIDAAHVGAGFQDRGRGNAQMDAFRDVQVELFHGRSMTI